MLSFAPARAFSSLTAASGAALASLSARGLGASSFSSSASAAAADDSAPASTSTPGAHAQRVRPVSLTLVLPDGRTRLPLRALPGSTLASVLLDHASEIPEQHAALEGEYSHGVSAVGLSPEGRGAADAVVEVPAEVAAAQPRGGGGAERRALEELAEVVRPELAAGVLGRRRREDGRGRHRPVEAEALGNALMFLSGGGAAAERFSEGRRWCFRWCLGGFACKSSKRGG